MQIELNLLFEVVFVSLLMKLIIGQWYPPVQKSLQAIFVIVIGSATGWFLNPTREGLVLGMIASAFCFYGRELTDAFKKVKTDIEDSGIMLNNKKK